MPKVPDFKAPLKTDIPELDDATATALDPVSDQIDRLTRATQGKLSHYDNLNCDVRDLKIRHGQPVTVSVKKIKGKPTGIDFLQVNIPPCHAQGFMEVVDDSTVRITAFFTNPPASFNPQDLVTTRVRIWGN